uniref:HSF-type DNA-binding domain-containing protein n=1 Tax=Glossina morsitans morsitans TaxID=37546 RepID=A0A1B0GBI0_GLOMM
MHTFTETGAGVPAFLAKLWRLVEDPETNNLICWSKDGRSFIIQNQAQFARELLPLNYKHNNMASFIRQLNMYGFHKITSIDNGGLKFDRDEMEFTHPCFKQHIKRKIASAKVVDDKTTVKPEAVSKVLQDVKAMRGRQDSLDSRFSVMKQENEALWREIASLRQKHAKQQQIVNKLIQFLITIVQPQRNMTGVKRHMQLMINDNPENATKSRKPSEGESNCGPVIRELSEELLDEVADVEPELIVPNSPFEQAAVPSQSDSEAAAACCSPQNTERPQSSVSMISQTYDYSNQSTEDSMGFGNNGANNNTNNKCSTPASAAMEGGLVQAVGPDGLKIIYHVTEVPDAQPQDSAPALPANYNEENVLTTPMVREEMARTQMLKHKNRQRRQKVSTSSTSSSPLLVSCPEAKKQRLINKSDESDGAVSVNLPKFQPIEVKSEQDIDPMLFLNAYPENRGLTPDPNLISPSFSEDSRQSLANLTAGIFGSASPRTSSTNAIGSSGDLYNPHNFIANDIPADIFEDSSIISSPSDNSNFSGENLKIPRRQQQSQQHVCVPLNNGKFSSHMTDNNSRSMISNGTDANKVNNNRASTSATAATSACTDDSDNNDGKHAVVLPSTSKGTAVGGTSNNLALAKYTNNKGNEDLMRDEVSGHLDNVQDELDTLKDLLRSDIYSMDHNTLLGVSVSIINEQHDGDDVIDNADKLLNETVTSNDDPNPMGFNNKTNINNTIEHINRILLTPGALDGDNLNKLFNDSELLGTYGLAFSGDNTNNEKKGSELMACHPMYDLSDIISDINDQNDLDADADVLGTSYRQVEEEEAQPSSVLNTPHHE